MLKKRTPQKKFFFNAAEKTAELDKYYSKLAARYKVGKINAGDFIETSETDGVHFDPSEHKVLGKTVAKYILNNWP